MKHYITALILAGGLAASQAHAACNYPVAPGKFPDGNQASKDEMLAAKGQVVQYNKDMETYLTCIQGEYDAKVAAETQRRRAGTAVGCRSFQRAAARVEGQERDRREGQEALLTATLRARRVK